MTRRLSSVLFLCLCLIGPSLGQDKEKKAYELIYQDIQTLKQDLLRLEESVGQNRTEISAVKSQITELITLIRTFRREQADLKNQQSNLPAQYQILLERLKAIAAQLARFSDNLTEIKQMAFVPSEKLQESEGTEKGDPTSSGETTGQEVEEGGEEGQDEVPILLPNLSPQEVYNMAYSDYLKGQYQLAIEGFSIYLNQFKDSPLADNALYWIGECYYSQQEYEKAIEQFDELILNFPRGDKIPAAYLKKGLSLIELDRKEQALSVFKLLISKYPLEEETKIAQEKIKELRKGNERYQQS